MTKLLLPLLFVSTLSHAAQMTCEETAKSKHDNGTDETILIDVSADQSSMKITIKQNVGGEEISAVAERDEHDSLKDADPNNPYNLDEDYDPKTEARFVTSNGNIATSDGDSIIFVEKQILDGKPGLLSLSSGQANDGESGDAWIWGRNGEYRCR